jgi:hypothetical protein
MHCIHMVDCRIFKANICYASSSFTCSNGNKFVNYNIYAADSQQCTGLPTYTSQLASNTCFNFAPINYVYGCLGATSSSSPSSKLVSKPTKKPKAKPKKITSKPAVKPKLKKSQRMPTAKPTPMATNKEVAANARQKQH